MASRNSVGICPLCSIVKYEIQRALNGCNGDCIDGTNDCNEPMTDDTYQSDETWILNYRTVKKDKT